jgi:hypothetical protein
MVHRSDLLLTSCALLRPVQDVQYVSVTGHGWMDKIDVINLFITPNLLVRQEDVSRIDKFLLVSGGDSKKDILPLKIADPLIRLTAYLHVFMFFSDQVFYITL